MDDTNFQKMVDLLNDHEDRLRKLEAVKNDPVVSTRVKSKERTLPEIIKGKNFKSGQEKIAIIVGYYEKIQNAQAVKEPDLKEGWRVGKFDGKYNPNFLARAIKDGLVRNISGNLDLSQTGENYWESFLK